MRLVSNGWLGIMTTWDDETIRNVGLDPTFLTICRDKPCEAAKRDACTAKGWCVETRMKRNANLA